MSRCLSISNFLDVREMKMVGKGKDDRGNNEAEADTDNGGNNMAGGCGDRQENEMDGKKMM